jgi:hypothetical protein
MTEEKTVLEELYAFERVVKQLGSGKLSRQKPEFQKEYEEKRERYRVIKNQAWEAVEQAENEPGFSAFEILHLKEGIAQLDPMARAVFYALMCSQKKKAAEEEEEEDPETRRLEWIREARNDALIAVERYNSTLHALSEWYATGNIITRVGGWALTVFLLLTLLFNGWISWTTICCFSLLCGIATHLADVSIAYDDYYGKAVAIGEDPMRAAKWAYLHFARRPVSPRPLLASDSVLAESLYDLYATELCDMHDLTGHIINELFALNTTNIK